MKNYISPEINIIAYETKDIITSSTDKINLLNFNAPNDGINEIGF